MGAGYFPRLIAVLCAGLALLVLARAIRTYFKTRRETQQIPAESPSPINWRGTIAITVAIVLFAALIRPAGLVPATLAAALACTLAQIYSNWIERLVLAATLSTGASLIFVEGLGLPFQLFPDF